MRTIVQATAPWDERICKIAWKAVIIPIASTTAKIIADKVAIKPKTTPLY